MKVAVAPQANQNNPVAVDLVLVRDKDLLKDLMKMPAADWFDKKRQILADHPHPSDIVVSSWEWVPSQIIPEFSVRLTNSPRATLVFANYFSAAPHRARVDPGRDLTITLMDDDISVTEMPAKGLFKLPKIKK